MARAISEEELQLKKRARRRLVGAIVLVTAVAVLLPMVLDSEPRPINQNVDIQIPSPDSGEFKPKSTPIKAAPDKGAAKAPDIPPKVESALPPVAIVDPASGPTKAPVKPDSGVAKPIPAEKPAKEASAKSSPKQSATGAFAVQIEALADSAKAKALEKKVASAGLPTYTEVVSTKSGEVTRVRAGPYETREAAEKARERLKTVGLEGKVVPK